MNSLSSSRFIYVLIARGSRIILTDYSEYRGNFQQICLNVLLKIRKQSKGVITYDYSELLSIKQQIVYEDQNDITYLCLTEGVKEEAAFSFLKDLKERFMGKYSINTVFSSFSFQLKEFSIEIKPMIHFYEDNPNYTKAGSSISKEQAQIERSNIAELLPQSELVYLTPERILNGQKDSENEFRFKMSTGKLQKESKRVIKRIALIVTSIITVCILLSLIF